mmetsp:Transcript_5886/g.12359  ORF Transcript_5886/g.12359 Transcript_5886/m.12359 type:complete len:221 (-) Transcript_5886:192-854(-)
MYYAHYRRRMRREELRRNGREAKTLECSNDKAGTEIDSSSVTSSRTADTSACTGPPALCLNNSMTSTTSTNTSLSSRSGGSNFSSSYCNDPRRPTLRSLPGRKKRLIALVSNGVSDRVQSKNQVRALNILAARSTPYVTVDGMDPEQREPRDQLFEVSGIRGNYPQFFFAYEDYRTAEFQFLGGYERLQNLNEVDSLPAAFLVANPNLETWDKIFGDVVE